MRSTRRSVADMADVGIALGALRDERRKLLIA
jgi:hypothetical protein